MNNDTRSVTEFYNAIASNYDGHMTATDTEVRKSIHSLIAQNVAQGNIMDFGGGSGLDLPWLVANNYNVLFVEPSSEMRRVAFNNYATSASVTFIESNTDFLHWNNKNLPFQQKVNGILANFAVLNCIENIDSLFEKFALLSSESCTVVATVIDPAFSNMRKHYSIMSAIRMSLGSKLRILNKYEGKYHPTYIHSLKSIEKASGKYFSLESITPLEPSSFSVLIFKKK